MGRLDQDVSDASLAVIAVVYDAQGVYSCRYSDYALRL